MADKVTLDLGVADVHAPSTAGVFDYARTPSDRTRMQHAAICVCVNADGHILAVSRPEPPYEMAIPGGMVEDGEEAEVAAARELREETDIVATVLEHIADLTSPGDGRPVHAYRAAQWTGEAFANEAGTRVAWMPVDDLMSQSAIYRPTLETLMSTDAFKTPDAPPTEGAREMISAAKRNALPDDSFALPAQRKYPLDTAARVRNAAARLEQEKKAGKVSDGDYKAARGRIAKAAKKFGITSEYNASDDGPKRKPRSANVHVRVDGLAHGGAIHVRHMSDGEVAVWFPPMRITTPSEE